MVGPAVRAAGAEAPAASPHPHPWFAPFAARTVWVRAASVALPVGLLQDCINQGDFWLRGEFTPAVITKSLLTPVVTLTVALVATASTHRMGHLPPPPTTHRPS